MKPSRTKSEIPTYLFEVVSKLVGHFYTIVVPFVCKTLNHRHETLLAKCMRCLAMY